MLVFFYISEKKREEAKHSGSVTENKDFPQQ